MTSKLVLIYFFFIIALCVTFGQHFNSLGDCAIKTNCSQCIQTKGCSWCKDSEYAQRRCFSNIGAPSSCKAFEDPRSSIISSESKISLINPTNSAIKLRPGSQYKINITMEYTDEKNRPLDLYILMDLSCTMLSHKEKVSNLARSLADGLKKITSDLRMGFGSFIDKPLLPYASVKARVDTCGNLTIKEKPYVFKNHQSLTSDIAAFISTVKESNISSNIDSPEGGLDALMQAISCKNQLNWRDSNKTRRLVVVSTDGPFHIAGDGKLGGIVLPNDGKCHLNTRGEYTHGLTSDYPSISQIRNIIQKQNVYVIFAVTDNILSLYETLVKVIGSASSTAQRIGSGQKDITIAKVIEEEYKKVVSTVNFQIPNNEYIKVTYFAKCPGDTSYTRKSVCHNLLPGEKVKYQVELELLQCPRIKSPNPTTIILRPFQDEINSLNLTIEMICNCQCELEIQKERKKCSDGQGYEQCGLCKCDEGWGGQFCNCRVTQGQIIDKAKCLYKGLVCSNHGNCLCGQCECDKGYSGTHCQCPDTNCPTPTTTDRGICNIDAGQGSCWCSNDISECNCTSGFTGHRCQCPTSVVTCTDKITQQVCNNLGSCECGSCKCNGGYYHGEFCQLKYSSNEFTGICSDRLMTKAKECVTCLSTTNRDLCDEQCVSVNYTFYRANDYKRITECEGRVTDEKNCQTKFIISYENVITKLLYIRLEEKPTCPGEAPVVPIALGVIGTMLIIGIISLLMWKLLTHIHDKNEFEKFENERAAVTFGQNQNPLYRGTVSEFENPVYSTED